MVARNTGSIGALIYDSIDNLPSTISGTIISDMVDMARIDVQNILDESIGTSIDEKYQSILYHLGRAQALGKLHSVGVGFNVSLGEFTVSKGATDAIGGEIQSALDRANASLKGLGRRVRYAKVWSSGGQG